MYRIGDRVIYEPNGRRIRATVKDLHYDGYFGVPTQATVEFDDWSLVPRQMRVGLVYLEPMTDFGTPYQNSEMEGCNCGVKFCRNGGKHSTWCRIYRSDRDG